MIKKGTHQFLLWFHFSTLHLCHRQSNFLLKWLIPYILSSQRFHLPIVFCSICSAHKINVFFPSLPLFSNVFFVAEYWWFKYNPVRNAYLPREGYTFNWIWLVCSIHFAFRWPVLFSETYFELLEPQYFFERIFHWLIFRNSLFRPASLSFLYTLFLDIIIKE